MDITGSDIYEMIVEHDWEGLKRAILDGFEEDFSDYDYKDWPLIFSVINEGAEDIACFWLDHGYKPYIVGGRECESIAHVAASRAYPGLLRKLVEKGAGVNKMDLDRKTPLWGAARAGSAECVKILLDAGANPDGFKNARRGGKRVNKSGKVVDTPLAVAKTYEVARLLLDAGAAMDIGMYGDSASVPDWANRIEEPVMPVSRAAFDGRIGALRALLEAGADPGCSNGQPLRCAAASRHFDEAVASFELLVDAGAQIGDSFGADLFRIAARTGNSRFCARLAELGARADNALQIAAKYGKTDCLELFRDRNMGDLSEAMYLAAKHGNLDILFRILDSVPNEKRFPALHGAIAGYRLELAQKILEMGLDANARFENGMTPLARLFAIDRRKGVWRFMESKSKYRVKRLDRHPDEEDYGAPTWVFNLNRPDNKLLEEIEKDVMTFAKDLLDHGADINAVDNMGRNVIWHACSMSWLESIPWLAAKGAIMEKRDNEGVNAFEAGCLSGETYTIEAMLKTGRHLLNARDDKGGTPLLKCIKYSINSGEGYDVIRSLIRNGADPDIENMSGESARKLAVKNRRLALVLETGRN